LQNNGRTVPSRPRLQTFSGLVSRGPLAAILPLFPRRRQLPIPVGLNLLLMPGEHIFGRDVADGAVQTDVIVMVYVSLNQTPRI